MPDGAITFMLVYAIASFLLTALFVRLGEQTRLAKKIRRHFYWFPFMPPVLLVWGFLQGMIGVVRSLFELLRYCFETLSGSKPIGDKELGNIEINNILIRKGLPGCCMTPPQPNEVAERRRVTRRYNTTPHAAATTSG